eukprot:scaffold110613_cov18-Prasinocladus_malaysianus.AAC.1
MFATMYRLDDNHHIIAGGCLLLASIHISSPDDIHYRCGILVIWPHAQQTFHHTDDNDVIQADEVLY